MKIIYSFSTIITLLFLSHSATAQGVLGTWKNIDDKDGKAKSHIEIYEEGGKYYGKVVKLLPSATLINCKKCKDDRKDQPIEGMVILWDLIKTGDSWDDGEIIDPKSGKIYDCSIKLNEEGNLDVRGYMGFSIIGRTQTWFRVNP